MQPTRAWPSSIWPAQPAQPTSSPLSSSSSARRTNRGEAWRAPERPRPPPASPPGHLLPGCLPPRCPETPRTPPRPLHLSSLPLDPIPSSASLSRTPPSGARRHRRRTHGHRPPLASPTPPKALPRPTLPPHPSKQHPEPCSDAITAIFVATAGDRRRSIHRRQVAPEPTETRSATTVSSWTDSPSSPARALALAPFPTSAEARRRHGRRAPCS